MKLVIGLGNVGPEYEYTRHNIGFMVADKLQTALGLDPFSVSKKHSCFLSEGKNIKIIKPTTLMNNSGAAVGSVTRFYKIPVDDIIVVHDDLDLPFGQLKIQQHRSAAGHNGVKSIIEKLGTSAFWRIRIGISGESRGKMPSEKYVLTNFTKEELSFISDHVLADAFIALMQIFKEGPERAAQEHNKKKTDSPPS